MCIETRVNAMTQLIDNFEKANPDITVKQVTFPYDDYQTRIIAAKLAGQGPDVMQLYYGWLDKFVSGQLLQPLDPAVFDYDAIEKRILPHRHGDEAGRQILRAADRGAVAWPCSTTRICSKKPALDGPPQTLDELVADAKATTETDGSGNITTEGITLDMGGQDHHWWREVLDRQYGGVPYNDDYTKVTYDDEAGLKALEFYTGLQTKEKVGVSGLHGSRPGRIQGRPRRDDDRRHIPSGYFQASNDFNWGVTELPANADGVRSNFASYFANGISSSTSGDKLKASEKFLQYLTSPEAMKVWLKVVGELPARKAAAMTDENLADPIYAPFLKALDYAHTTLFKDESGQRQAVIDMVNRVLLDNQDPKASLDQAAKEEQAVIDAAME